MSHYLSFYAVRFSFHKYILKIIIHVIVEDMNQALNAATQQLMANSITNTAAQLNSTRKIQTRIASAYNKNEMAVGSQSSSKGGLAIGSVVSSISTPGEGPIVASVRVSAGDEQSVGSNQEEQGTTDVRFPEDESSSAHPTFISTPFPETQVIVIEPKQTLEMPTMRITFTSDDVNSGTDRKQGGISAISEAVSNATSSQSAQGAFASAWASANLQPGSEQGEQTANVVRLLQGGQISIDFKLRIQL